MRPPIVVLEGVHARDAAAPRGRSRGAIAGVSLALPPGVHAVLGTPEDGTIALLDAVTGARPPQRGRVTVAGRDPARTAFLRARIGMLPPEPSLPAAPTVRDAVRLAMRARGETGDRFDAVIDPLGLSPLHGRDPRALSFAEERAVELALALSTPAPLLVALHEPLADAAVAKTALVASRLREIAASGACVIVATSSPSDARLLADRVLVLHRGLVVREASGKEGLGLPAPADLVVWVQHGARELAAALSRRSDLLGVAWEEAGVSAGPWPGAAAVRVRAATEEIGALAVAEAVGETGVEVEGIEQRAPALGEVREATEALWRMARMRAMAPAMMPAPAMPPAPAPAMPPVPEPASAPAISAEPAAAEPAAVPPDAPRDAILPDGEGR